MEELELEKQKLEQTIHIIKSLLKDEKIELEDLFNNYMGSKEELWTIADRKKIHIANLELAKDKPYFARIDFKSDIENKISTIYIGKNGINKSDDIIVTDWRAPISSIYYDAELGKCSYKSPIGDITGELLLKRQYEIEKGKLLSYFDVSLVSNDELLQKYLNSNNDERLSSIVSTIQKEQNDVIRRPLGSNLIIQGVAGSGKTTVALHRIAFLVYNYMKSISQNQYVVIGPNPVFMKYIKSVLPDLDVTGVVQTTYENIARNYINEYFEINSFFNKANNHSSQKDKNSFDKFKSSILYKNMLDEFLETYFYSIVSKDLLLGDFVVMKEDEIKRIFVDVFSLGDVSLSNKVKSVNFRICKIIEEHFDDIISEYSDYSFNLFRNAESNEEKEILRKRFVKEREELHKGCRNLVKKYFAKANVSTVNLYKLFIKNLSKFNFYHYDHIKELKANTLLNVKQGYFDFADLAAMVYIKSKIEPNKEYSKIRHVIIDEAQDLSEFDFFVLKKIFSDATFSIFGDLAQSIYGYRSINNWSNVNKLMFNDSGEIINFNKSYRTTSEIMDVADDVSDSLGLSKSEMVIRHGDVVEFQQANDKFDIPDIIIKKVEEYINKGYKTIAIISKTDLLSRIINDELKKRGLDIPNLTYNDDVLDDKFNICTLSNYLAKGLEFDAVIINNANEEIYSSDDDLDMKLLYVAITRALHDLNIVYSDNITSVLRNRVKKNSDKVLRKKYS